MTRWMMVTVLGLPATALGMDVGGGRAALGVGDLDGDGWSQAAGDCDDRDPRVHPGAPEEANGLDDDCDGLVDEGLGSTGTTSTSTSTGTTSTWTTTTGRDQDGDGWTDSGGDCDDTDPAVHPGAPEVANGLDDDCDGLVDEGSTSTTSPGPDRDGDGWTEGDGDCDDQDPTVHPGAPEVANGADDDCDGLVDEGLGTTGTGGTSTGGTSTGGTTDTTSTGGTSTGGTSTGGVPEDTGGEDGGSTGCLGTGGSYAWLFLLPLGWLGRRGCNH